MNSEKSNQKKGVVYLITNEINGKVYVGQTINSMRSRLSKHLYLANTNSNRHLYRSMRKYGIDNFSANIICECESKDELDFAEIYWISHYKSTSREHGYNYESGGPHGSNLDENSKSEIQNKRKETFKINPYKMTEETKIKIRASKIKSGYIKNIEEKKKVPRSYAKSSKPIDFDEVNRLILMGCDLNTTIRSVGICLSTFNKRVWSLYKMKPYEYTQYILTGKTGIVSHILEMEQNPQFVEFDIEYAKTEILKYRNMREIASELGIAYPTLYSRFIKIYGITPVEYLQQRKRELILIDIENRISIDEILSTRHVTAKTVNSICVECHGMLYSQYRKI